MRFPHRGSEASSVNPSDAAAKAAHDALLELKPGGVEHEHCDLCVDPAENKEVAQVAGDRTYTEAEHVALMADAVTRETASLTEATSAFETTVSEQASKIDTLEAEKAALETKVNEVQGAFDEYKSEIERAAEVESAKASRVEVVKAAVDSLPDTYFTDERVLRWASMTEEAFLQVVEDIKTAFVGVEVKPKETAAFSGGTTPTSPATATLGGIFAARRGETKN
jgi:hypothetical protein